MKKRGKKINIDLDALKSIADIGLNRAYVFLGLGVNASRTDALTTWQLDSPLQIIVVPAPKSDSEIAKAKKEFERWIVGNSLRELLETYTNYLEGVYDLLLLINNVQGAISDNTRVKKFKNFSNSEIYKKLSILKKEHQVVTNFTTHLRSINKVRNCLTHNRGMVRKKDAGANNRLTMKWRTFDIFVKRDGGRNEKITKTKLPFQVDAREPIFIKNRNRQKSFATGKLINLTPRDLHEICLTVSLATSEIHNSLLARLKSQGLKIHTKAKE